MNSHFTYRIHAGDYSYAKACVTYGRVYVGRWIKAIATVRTRDGLARARKVAQLVQLAPTLCCGSALWNL